MNMMQADIGLIVLGVVIAVVGYVVVTIADRLKRNRRGHTMIEVVAVVALIGVVITLTLAMVKAGQKVATTKYQAYISQVEGLK